MPSLRFRQQVCIQQKRTSKQDEEAGLIDNQHSVMMSNIDAIPIAENE